MLAVLLLINLWIDVDNVYMKDIQCTSLGGQSRFSILGLEDRQVLSCAASMAYINPFLPERIEWERKALGSEFIEEDSMWNLLVSHSKSRRNVDRVVERLSGILPLLTTPIASWSRCESEQTSKQLDEREQYAAATLFYLYHRYLDQFWDLIEDAHETTGALSAFGFYPQFQEEVRLLFPGPAFDAPEYKADHLFALAFQIARAFFYTHLFIIGDSTPTVELRARVWQSIFGADIRKYRSVLYAAFGDISTLILGESGTGKEVVARAIAFSRYIPFDAHARTFKESFLDSFFPLNLAAFSSTIIESELFGHRKGAFTGASIDRGGWFAQCGEHGSVFLDEIGEIDPLLQVKLLRVIETRSFYPLGDSRPVKFRGKLLSATNRDPTRLVEDGAFREDFYYRLCSDVIRTPTLYERLQSSSSELNILLRFLARRLVSVKQSEQLADSAAEWIRAHLGLDYKWPGNVRELDQCLRNVIVQGCYRPIEKSVKTVSGSAIELAEAMERSELSADEMVSRYCEIVYSTTGSYEQTGRRLRLDRRTVKRRLTR